MIETLRHADLIPQNQAYDSTSARKLTHMYQVSFTLPEGHFLWEHLLDIDISNNAHKQWQQQWDMNINNKLFQIHPTLGEWRPAFRASRREQVVISRLRIGHTRLTHAFILKQEPQPQCLTCQTTCTVKRILIVYRTFAVIRKWFFKLTSLTELFENIKIDDVLSFLRKTGLYEKIWRIRTD